MSQLSNQLKPEIEWEEVNLEELFPEPDEYDFENQQPLSPTQVFLKKYPDKGIFFILHVNVNLNKILLKQLSKVDGVERLIPLSRYRAVFNFGHMFKDRDNEVDPFYSTKKRVLKCIDKYFYPEKYKEVTENPEE